jgi:hypothetical protein
MEFGFDSSCITCGIFQQLDSLSIRYGREVFEALAPATRQAFSAFIGLWFAFQLFYKGLLRGALKLQDFMAKMVLFAVLHVALMSSSYYWDFVYVPIRETTSAISQLVVRPAGEITDPTFTGLLKVVETEVWKVVDLSRAMLEDAGWFSPTLLIAGLLLLIPFLFVLLVFVAFLLEGLFKFLAITVLAPLAIVCIGFDATRGFAISAGRILLGGALTIIFAAVAMGFTVAILRAYIAPPLLPIEMDGELKTRIAHFPFSKAYFGLLILGFISVLFHLKAATLAANISGASDGPGAAATVVGAGMAALGTAKAIASAPVRRYAGKLWDKADAFVGGRTSDGVQRLLDKFAPPKASAGPGERS